MDDHARAKICQLVPLYMKIISWKICIVETPSSAWKVSKYKVFSGQYFAVFGLNTEIYEIFCPNKGKYGPKITLYLVFFHTV